MKLEIRNVRGLADASLEMAPIALVAGVNGAGKTSAATALAAALMQTAAPLPGMTKAAARDLLRDHESRGRAVLTSDGGSTTVNWPGGSVSTDGEPPRATAVACGLTKIADLPEKQRTSYLIDILGAMPTVDDLRAELNQHGINDQTVDAIWKEVQERGWDAAHKRAQENGARAKGAWEQITGERWGARKGEEWRPAAFASAETMPDPEALGAEIDAAKAALDAAIASQAVSQDRVAQLRSQAEAAVQWETALATAQAEFQRIDADRAAAADEQARAQAELDALPKPGQVEQTAPCPECGAHLVVVSRTVLKAPDDGGPSDDENERRSAAIDEQSETVRQMAEKTKEINLKSQQARRSVDDAERNLQACRQAAEELAGLSSGGTTAEDVAAAREAVENAEHGLAALRQWHDAGRKHVFIQTSGRITDVLSPSGLRQSVLSRSLENFNQRVAAISIHSGWKKVEITKELIPTLSGRGYIHLSEGERFRVNAVLQLALAEIDGSSAVVVDAADVLDRAGRNGLFAALRFIGLPAMVCMTMSARDEMPALDRAGLGRSYWAEAATVSSSAHK